jgi:hypothetical protein
MNYAEIVRHVESLGGLRRAEAKQALAATVAVLSMSFAGVGIDLLCRELPPRVDCRRLRVPLAPSPALDDIYRAIGVREHVPQGQAVEHAQVVCRALARLLPEETLVHVRKDLPVEVAALFDPGDDRHDAPLYEAVARPVGKVVRETLATGRPGARHPLSESRPETAQRDSIARSDSPHASTKLATARGLTQERLGETLAEGEPGPHRPIATAR